MLLRSSGYIPGDFEYSEKSEGSEYTDTERLICDVWPDNFKYTPEYYLQAMINLTLIDIDGNTK